MSRYLSNTTRKIDLLNKMKDSLKEAEFNQDTGEVDFLENAIQELEFEINNDSNNYYN